MVSSEFVQQVTSVWIKSCSGTISTVSSMAIIYMIVSPSDRERRLCQPNNRFLVAMSIFDVLQSVAFMASVLPVPKSTGYYGAMGNHFTCSCQGFLLVLGTAVPWYNASLCIWFLMSIKYNMRPEVFNARIGKYCHVLSTMIPVGSAVMTAVFDLYGSRGNICHIPDENRFSKWYLVALIGTANISASLIIFYCNAAIYHSFLEKERNIRRYSLNSLGNSWRPQHELQGKKLVAKQAILFSCASLTTIMIPSLAVFLPEKKYIAEPGILDIPIAIFMPLQGFWNFIIFSNRKITRIRKDYPELSILKAYHKMIFQPNQVVALPPRRQGRRGSARNSQQTKLLAVKKRSAAVSLKGGSSERILKRAASRNSLLSLTKERNGQAQIRHDESTTNNLFTDNFEQAFFKNGEEFLLTNEQTNQLTTHNREDIDQTIATTYTNEEEEKQNKETNQFTTHDPNKDIDQGNSTIKAEFLEEILEEGKLRIGLEEEEQSELGLEEEEQSELGLEELLCSEDDN